MNFFRKIVAILVLSILFTKPILAATTVKKDVLSRGNVIQESPVKFIIPNYIGERKTSFAYNPYDPENIEDQKHIYKEDVFVVKRSPDHSLFKITVDAKKFSDVDHVAFIIGDYNYYDKTNVYSSRDSMDFCTEYFSSNGLQKEAVLSLPSDYIKSLDEDTHLRVSSVFFDENEEELYIVPDLEFLVLNEYGTEKTPTSFKRINIEINGKKISSKIRPIQENESIFVPIRLVSEHLGMNVTYDQTSKNITLTKEGNIINFKVDGKETLTNNGTTFVPVRMIAETLNSHVQWNPATQTVMIVENL